MILGLWVAHLHEPAHLIVDAGRGYPVAVAECGRAGQLATSAPDPMRTSLASAIVPILRFKLP